MKRIQEYLEKHILLISILLCAVFLICRIIPLWIIYGMRLSIEDTIGRNMANGLVMVPFTALIFLIIWICGLIRIPEIDRIHLSLMVGLPIMIDALTHFIVSCTYTPFKDWNFEVFLSMAFYQGIWAVTEEALFRGFIFFSYMKKYRKRKWGYIIASCKSALICGLYQFAYLMLTSYYTDLPLYRLNLQECVYGAFSFMAISMVFQAVALYHQTILASSILHIIWNMAKRIYQGFVVVYIFEAMILPTANRIRMFGIYKLFPQTVWGISLFAIVMYGGILLYGLLVIHHYSWHLEDAKEYVVEVIEANKRDIQNLLEESHKREHYSSRENL